VDEKVWKETHSKESTLHLNGLESDTTFCFKVTANFANGMSMTNKSSTHIRTASLPLAHRTKKNSNFIKKGPPEIYQLKMKENHKDCTNMVSWQSFGEQQ